MRVAVLTISDSSHAGERADRSGPLLRQHLENLGYQVDGPEVLPDEAGPIASKLEKLCNTGKYDAVLTTGGTGVAPRDVTPEATRAVIDREIPGLAEWMRYEGMKKVHTAILSRGIAGSRGRTLIVNLPGSPKGAVESFQAIEGVVPHIVDLLHGKTAHKGDETGAGTPASEK